MPILKGRDVIVPRNEGSFLRRNERHLVKHAFCQCGISHGISKSESQTAEEIPTVRLALWFLSPCPRCSHRAAQGRLVSFVSEPYKVSGASESHRQVVIAGEVLSSYIAIKLEAIATRPSLLHRLEAIAFRLEAIAIRFSYILF